MKESPLLPYHEAAHVVAGWMLDIPIDRVVVDKEGWGVKKSLWFNMTRQFREVSQETVRRDVIFCLAGEYGEMLVGGENSTSFTFDDHLARFLCNKFRLNLTTLREEAFALVFAQRETIKDLAGKLIQKAEQLDQENDEVIIFSPYEMSVERMNWLARGKC